MQGLYLLDNNLVANGTKTMLATGKTCCLEGEHLLVVKGEDGYAVPGRVAVGTPREVDLQEFDALAEQHRVTRAQRRKWWPEAERLCLHPLTYTAGSEQQVVEIAPGSTMQVELVGLGLKEITVEDGWHVYEIE